MPLAFLPQHVAEVMGAAIAVLFIAHGVSVLKGNRLPGENPRWATRVGVLEILFGAAIGVFSLTTNAESPHRPDHGGWGATTGVIILIVWLILLGLFSRLGWHQGPDARGPSSRALRRGRRDRRPRDGREDGW
jgi:hypothetical protein